jgi:hypothetical protein
MVDGCYFIASLSITPIFVLLPFAVSPNEREFGKDILSQARNTFSKEDSRNSSRNTPSQQGRATIYQYEFKPLRITCF